MKTTITIADIDRRTQALDGERKLLDNLRRFVQPGRGVPVLEIPVGVPMAEIERLSILAMLEDCGGNRSAAAQRLGISRRTIAGKLADYNAGRCQGLTCEAQRAEGEAWAFPALCPRCTPRRGRPTVRPEPLPDVPAAPAAERIDDSVAA